MIKTIVFDIGGVLLDIHPERTFQYIGDSLDMNQNEIANSFPWELHDEYEKGNLNCVNNKKICGNHIIK